MKELEKFRKFLLEIKEKYCIKTTGEALKVFINLADNTPYVDYEIENLDDIVETIKGYSLFKEEVGE